MCMLRAGASGRMYSGISQPPSGRALRAPLPSMLSHPRKNNRSWSRAFSTHGFRVWGLALSGTATETGKAINTNTNTLLIRRHCPELLALSSRTSNCALGPGGDIVDHNGKVQQLKLCNVKRYTSMVYLYMCVHMLVCRFRGA